MKELLQIDLMGMFRLRYMGQPVPAMNRPRLQELLAYLLLRRNAPQQRQQIIYDLWFDNPEKQTPANLRQLLYQLRNSLPDADSYIKADTGTVQWDPDIPYLLDVAEFERLLNKAREAKDNHQDKEELNVLKKAVPLYRGPLLAHSYEEWIIGERNRLKEGYTGALERLVDLLEEERNYDEALVYAGKMLEFDPCSEAACRRLIQLHALNEDRTSVIRTYKAFKTRIQEDLDIEPGPKTKELYQRLSESFRQSSDDYSVPAIQPAGNGSETHWPMIGRKEEWKYLLQAWDEARSGTLQWVLIRGETGIGKSRLGGELLAYLSRQGFAAARARCYEAAGTPGYGPVADWLRSPSFSTRIGKLEEVWLDELSRLLPELSPRLQNVPDYRPWDELRLKEALAHVLLMDGKPVLLLLEDLQWCDSETLSWLGYLINRQQPTPILIVATLRTTAGNPYANEAVEGLLSELRRKRCIEVIEPTPLDREETVELASHLLERELDKTMGLILYRETEGNPLFIVEMIRELPLLEQFKGIQDTFIPPDRTPSQIRELPRLVSDVISRRFQYLSPESREVLGIAAVVGREFSFGLLSSSCDFSEEELVNALEELIRQYIIQEVRTELYNFIHDKLREVAYQELSITRRSRHHLRIATAIKAIHEQSQALPYQRMAFHYERAGEIESALDHYLKAAGQALKISSLQDVGMLHHALVLLHKLPGSFKRDHSEFELTTLLALSYLQQRRFNTDEVFLLCERVYLLGSELGEPPPMVILFTLILAKLISGDTAIAIELGIVMHTLAKELGDTAAEVESCYLLGLSNRIGGNITESARCFREGMERLEEGILLSCMQIYDLDGNIILRMEAAVSLLLSGGEKEARRLMERTTERVHETGQVYGKAYVCYATAWFEALLRNEQAVRKATEQFREFEIETEPMHWSLQADILLGWSMAARRSPERGIERIQNGIKKLEELNHTLDLPFYYTLYAESLIIAERYSEARTAICLAREMVERTGARFGESEILRVEAELNRIEHPADTHAARTALEKAIGFAHQQGCLLFEQRATLTRDRMG